MRLAVVERGHSFPTRLLIRLFQALTGTRFPEVMRTALYRPKVFGQPCMAWAQSVMRGQSGWTVGERELFSAFTSGLNQCPF